MSVAFDLASGQGITVGATSFTFSHTTSGAERCLYVAIAYNADPGTASATYNTVAMTQVAARTSGFFAYVWRLVNPALGANNVVISQTNSVTGAMIAVSFTGVHQTTPDGTPVTETDGDGSVAVTGALVDDMVVDFFLKQNGIDSTAGANQTERIDQLGSFGDTRRAFSSTEAGSDPNTMSWSVGAETTFLVGIRVISSTIAVAVTDTFDLAEALSLAVATTQSVTDALALVEALTILVIEGFAHLYETFPFVEELQIAHIKGFRTASTWTDRPATTELDHIESDLAPGDTAAWVAPTAHTAPTWTEGDADCSATVRDEVVPAILQSDTFCAREFPTVSVQAVGQGCNTFTAVTGTVGSGPRLEKHALEEVPGTSLIVGLVMPSVAPHLDIAIAELDTPYTSVTKTVIETPTNAETVGAMRVSPTTKTLVAAWWVGPSSQTVRFTSIPFVSGAYNYAGKTLGTIETSLETGGLGLGVCPLPDGRWLVVYVNKNTTLTELHWAYSQNDGVSWSTPSVLAIANSIVLQVGLAGFVPVVAYSATGVTPTLKLRALNLTTDTWGTEFDPTITLADKDFVSLAPRPDANQFGLFYNTSADQLAKLKIFTVTSAGVITLNSTETVWNPTPSNMGALFGTYHSVATDGATWILMATNTANDLYKITRLSSGTTWTAALVAALTSPGAPQIPIVPRCATTLPVSVWLSGNSLQFRRFTF